MTTNNEFVIDAKGLTRRFKRKIALNDVSLQVPKGVVFGLVGENGAGKTTFIRHCLGLLEAEEGSINLFGMNPVDHPVEVLSRIGYLSEDRDMPGWMRVDELINYVQAFYPGWDQSFADELLDTFDLDLHTKVKRLSRGEKAKLGLLAALSYRPELLLLDEPSSGLDAVVRKDILGAIIRTVADEGRTVFFSSHLLDEVERVSDHVAMIYHGRIVKCMEMAALKEAHTLVTLKFSGASDIVTALPGVLQADQDGDDWTIMVDGSFDVFRDAASTAGVTITEHETPSLDAIFVAYAGATKKEVVAN